jgi:hypothetical protein
MTKYKVTAVTEFTEKSDLEINNFIDNIKESLENVYIISIESLPMNYDKYNKYTYKVKFYNDIYLII